MADFCGYCETRHPEGGTNHLVLNGGALWIEFCPKCGEKETLTSDTGEVITVAELFKRTGEQNKDKNK